MKNYLEYVHVYKDDVGLPTEAVNEDVTWAVRPSVSHWNYVDQEAKSGLQLYPESFWKIEGVLDVYGLEDVAGLRGLLDLIEQDLLSDDGSV